MPNPIKRDNDPALSRQQAVAGAEVTRTDQARALAKWRRRLPQLEARLQEAARGQ